MAKTTELVNLLEDRSDNPHYAVCYARGASFRKEGGFWKVEKGRRTVVLRVLCLDQHFGNRCKICPNTHFTVTFKARGSNGP